MKKLLCLLTFLPCLAFAWTPTKPITVVIPVTPGAGQELAFRAATANLEKEGKAKFVYEYRPGADGNIGMNHFAEALPDGYTIALPACQSAFVASDTIYADMIKYNPMEFAMIANLGKSPLAFVANINSPVNTVNELITAAKKGDGKFNIAVGSAAHKLAVDYFLDKTNTNKDKIGVPSYKGPMPALHDVAAGHVEFGVVPAAIAYPLFSTGKIKIIGISGESTLARLPNTPLMNKYVTGLNVAACWNIILPKGTSAEITKWYVDTFSNALSSSEYKRFADENLILLDSKLLTPEGVYNDMKELRRQWQPYMKNMEKQQ